MKILGRMGVAVVLAVLAGCIPLSLEPIYTPDVLVNEPRLEGVWQESGNSWTITRADEVSYAVVMKDETDTAEYVGHLIKLNNHYFLDLFVQTYPGYPDKTDELPGMQLVPVHAFYRLVFTEQGFEMYALDFDWLQKRVERGRLWAPHTRVEAWDNYPVFTGSPKRMQRFLRKWANDDEVWGDAITFKKMGTE